MEINNKYKRTRQKCAILELSGAGQLLIDLIDTLKPGLATSEKLMIIQNLRHKYLLELREVDKDIKQTEIWK
jgi:hypothetical protein